MSGTVFLNLVCVVGGYSLAVLTMRERPFIAAAAFIGATLCAVGLAAGGTA